MLGTYAPAAVDHTEPQKGGEQGDESMVIGGIDVEDLMFLAKRKTQVFLDKISFYPGRRWIAFTVVLAFFLLRMYMQQGYAVIAYLLGLFYLNNIMLFLAPAEDPEELEFKAGEFVLPT